MKRTSQVESTRSRSSDLRLRVGKVASVRESLWNGAERGFVHLIYLVVLALPVRIAVAQVILPGSMDAEYQRLLLLMNPQLMPSITHNTSILRGLDDSLSWNIWENSAPRTSDERQFSLIDPLIETNVNTTYPRGYNDGPVWSGRGFNLVVAAGVAGRYRSLSYTFMPVVWVSQNAAYRLADSLYARSRYSYQFERGLDWVQRFGDGAYASIHPGQSEVRLTIGNGTLGISSQNFTWGPGQRNHILMSNGGGGFYHVELGTYHPQQTPIGAIEVKTFWGRLDASDYYGDGLTNTRRFVTGFAFGYAPVFAKGLLASFHRVMYKDAGDLEIGDLVEVLYRFTSQDDTLNGGGINDLYDQLASVSFDWKLPEAGFEAYFEFALNDFNGSIRRILTETEHTRAYTLGLIKTFPLSSARMIVLSVEHTSLSLPRSDFYRSSPSYYVHSIIEAGYTNRGQLLGAGVGPGGTSDYAGITYYERRGSLRFDIQRIRFNEDYFVRAIQNPDRHDAEFTFGLTGRRFLDGVDLSAALLFSHRFNTYYEEWNDLSNLHIELGVRVRL